MSGTLQSSEVSQSPKREIGTGTNDMTGTTGMTGATGPITRAISRRRSHRHQWRLFERIFTVILDIILVGYAFYLAYYIRYTVLPDHPLLKQLQAYITGSAGKPPPDPFSIYIPLGTVSVIGLITIFAFRRLYHIRLTGSWLRQAWLITSSTTTGITLLMTYYFFFQSSNELVIKSRLLVLFFWMTTIGLLSLGRLLISGIISILYRMGMGETRLLIVGSGRLGKMVMQHITASPHLGYSIVGFLHDLNEPPGDFGRFKMLGTINDIGLVIRSMQVDEVIIALPSTMHQHAIRSVKLCERLGTSFKLIPDVYELNLSRIDMEAIEGIPLIGIKQVSLNTVQRLTTRLIDIIVSALVLLLGSPLWICLALAVRFSSPGPIIYKQIRIGLNGQPFPFYKFRTMYKDADQRLAQLLGQNEAKGPLFKMKADPRRTPLGKFLRRTSLDEIPQLFSILKGDMSLVGPRAAVPREVAQYEEWQKGRLAIKPGLTGLWQVRGRSDLSFDEGVLMDLYYIENWSLRLYLQILLRTIPAVLFSRGAY